MRVKVESVAPLPHVKAWFSAHALPSVYDLKISLCTGLKPFKDMAIEAQDIVLLLDDFELLDTSSIDVVRDGDLIVIKQTNVSLQHKRKTPPLDVESPARKRTKTDSGKRPQFKENAPTISTKRRIAESFSESSSESSSDSSSDSETSSSDSDSDSSSSSSPSATTSRQHGVKAASKTSSQVQKAHPINTVDQPPPAPPGLGKPSTHSRNLRRRRKKMYERLVMTVEPASANEIPLGPRARTLEPTSTIHHTPPSAEPEPAQTEKSKGKDYAHAGDTAEPPLFMMASMQNKNKRRGFKDALTRGVPAKIIFSEDGPSASTSAQPHIDGDPDTMLVEAPLQVQSQGTPQSQKGHKQQPRLIPPSEKQELGQLPPKMFVTSVDVEEGLWSAKRKNKKKKKKALVEETYPDGLPYDDEAAAAATASQAAPIITKTTEHAVVAARWDTLRKITNKSDLSVGATVAWKALGINFTTLTPETILHVGRVLQCDGQLVVEPIVNSGTAEVSFGGPVVADEDGIVEETFEWSDVLQGDWRLVATH